MNSTQTQRLTTSLFDQAAKVFDGWTDANTGMRVLRIHTRGNDADGSVWATQYHQFNCFYDGGRKVVLHGYDRKADPPAPAYFMLDLTTGEREFPFPAGTCVTDVRDRGHIACLLRYPVGTTRAAIWDMQACRELASVDCEGWTLDCINLLSDGERAIVFCARGNIYRERVDSRHYLLCPDESPRLLLDAREAFCSHVQSCPTDPELYTYDRWPSPARYVDQAFHVRSLDGRTDHPVPLSQNAQRPAVMFGARDHYVWTPDGNRIVSYLSSDAFEFWDPAFDHFKLQWWLSATDWRTGEDFAAPYPEGRWGGHMQVSPDSRYIICAGGPGYDNLMAIDIEQLRHGWNEHIICSYPESQDPKNLGGPFAYPFVLPDQSGVIFCAGWPGPEHGVYLAEWPSQLN